MGTPRQDIWSVRERLLARPAVHDRILLAVAHPDDEVIGCGGHLRLWSRALTIVHATNGSPALATDRHAAGYADASAYAAARRERFRLAPAYDFARRPHARPLFYERFDRGVTSWEEWHERAGRTLR